MFGPLSMSRSISLLAVEGSGGVAGSGDQVVEDDISELERQSAGLDPRHQQDVLDEAEQPRRVSLDHVDVVVLFISQLFALEHFGVATDRGQRCPQLVGDEGEELVLDGLGCLELINGVAQLCGLIA